jgi:hypothetical protein
MLASTEDKNLKVDYERLKSSFQDIEHGEDFIQQLDTAYKVFSHEPRLTPGS